MKFESNCKRKIFYLCINDLCSPYPISLATNNEVDFLARVNVISKGQYA